MRQAFVDGVRAWSTRRRFSVYLIAECCLLGLAITAVHFWRLYVPPAAHLFPWLGATVGGLIGMFGLKKPNRP